ncbi:hypothetical protein KRP22_009247 [Phytophthora ramorum]|nr:hypothetical protein KRP22_8077 [Phytophthora ramorum]
MERWNSLAAMLVAAPDFLRKNLTGKTAQNRVNALLATAQKKNNAAARLSGVTESHSVKDVLLDELLSKIEDGKHERAAKKKIKAEENAEKESAGETVRKLALERLKRLNAGVERPNLSIMLCSLRGYDRRHNMMASASSIVHRSPSSVMIVAGREKRRPSSLMP